MFPVDVPDINTTRWCLLLVCLVLSLCFVFPAAAEAAAPASEKAPPCVQCHATEAATWEQSSHAHAATVDVTCETCHSTYDTNHPQGQMMPLDVGSSTCEDCHAVTYEQWHETAHAGASVQCSSCHLPHSQEARLEGETLCASCHREISDDFAHHDADVHCTDCHFSSPSPSPTGAETRTVTDVAAPNHTFEPGGGVCVDCHGRDLHSGTFDATVQQIDCSRIAEMSARVQELSRDLEDAEDTNRSLQTMSVVSLGFGLGSGGVLGIIFTLAVSYISQRKVEK